MTNAVPPSAPRRLGRWVLGLAALGFVCFYFATASSMLLMVECPSFSFFAPNPVCRPAMYWSTAGLVAFGAAIALAIFSFVKRRG